MTDRLASARKEALELKRQIEVTREKKNDTTLIDAASHVPPLARLQMKCVRKMPGHLSKVLSLHWAADSRHLLSASQDGKLLIWHAVSGNKVAIIPLKSAWVMTCAYSPNGNLVASGGLDNIVSVFPVKTRDRPILPCRELASHTGYISCIRFVSDRQLLSSSADQSIILWDLETRKKVQSFQEHTEDVMSVSMAPDNSTFVSGGLDKVARIWDLRTGRSVQHFPGHELDINAVQFFPSGLAFGTASDDSTCRIFDIRADRELVQFKDKKVNAPATSLSFSRSGRVLFAAYDDFRCIAWDTLKARRVAEFESGTRVSQLQVSPDGNGLATASWDTTVKVWV
ncbi:Guanine nucleotide-binding protein, beta subunit [Carpediemonas membranifera]|uniref:Guanine nucleotide-binding protein, beta subunit n=1 Tax=Carpediemonas membranifera TaxID=201153 RepID=A0A8J6BFL7_9EUKA|nr:Guanine nucleotide-binding protein, beta subunit [Carpediemonas membranifera]|eukprot:KAG9396447.1 Guanine nucleotide-binding protein, beta subunit [Carpediemonas membranifera]